MFVAENEIQADLRLAAVKVAAVEFAVAETAIQMIAKLEPEVQVIPCVLLE